MCYARAGVIWNEGSTFMVGRRELTEDAWAVTGRAPTPTRDSRAVRAQAGQCGRVTYRQIVRSLARQYMHLATTVTTIVTTTPPCRDIQEHTGRPVKA